MRFFTIPMMAFEVVGAPVDLEAGVTAGFRPTARPAGRDVSDYAACGIERWHGEEGFAATHGPPETQVPYLHFGRAGGTRRRGR